MAIDLSSTFDARQWAAVVAGAAAVDAQSLLRWRLQPPRPAQLTVQSPQAPRGWSHADVHGYIDVAVVAEQFMVRPETIRARCRRWGIPVLLLTVGGGGLGWPRRRSYLTAEGLRVLTVRSVKLASDGSRVTGLGTSARSTASR